MTAPEAPSPAAKSARASWREGLDMYLQPRVLIKDRVLRIEKEVWRMVDVHQNGMKPSSGRIRIKTLL